MSDRIYITDVAPRDGLQNEKKIITTADKVRLVRLLDASGVDEIEVSSFVSPKWIPQLGDAAEVFAELAGSKPTGVKYSALVPNEKGMEAALLVNQQTAKGARTAPLIDRISLFTAASESFARKNTNATIDETFARFKPVIASAQEHGLGVRAYVSTVIACPFEGRIAPTRVAELAARLLAMGADDIDLGDTIGAATPESLRAMLSATIAAIGNKNIRKLSLHLHDTFGRAAECLPVALELGLRSFDEPAAGGLGGCPYASTPARRAPGNISTEGLVRALHAAGFTTGVDLAKLAKAATFARYIVATEIA